MIEKTCEKHREELVELPSLAEILHYDGWAREYAQELIESGSFRTKVVA